MIVYSYNLNYQKPQATPPATVTYGLTQDGKEIEWFDTFKDAHEGHQQKDDRFNWFIVVNYGEERLGAVFFNPRAGYFPTGFFDDKTCVDHFREHGVYAAIAEVSELV
jgi:hypothetical protein